MGCRLYVGSVKTDRSSLSVQNGRFQVNTISIIPEQSRASIVLGHGAGAGMEHQFMTQLAMNLAVNGIGSFRYNFPYIEQGRRTPSSASISQATVKAAVAKARELFPDQLLLVGGKSYGGRMSSQAQSTEAFQGVSGLVFYGFPLHAPGKPGNARGEHLKDIEIPMLFLQGSRDKLADLSLLQPLIQSLGAKATMEVLDGADHSFNMLKASPKSSAEVQLELAQKTTKWVSGLSAL